jgi:hydroxypyruvate isomerase
MDRRTMLTGAVALAGGASALAKLPESARPRQDEDLLLRTPHTRFAANLEMWWSSLPFLDRIRRAAWYGFPAIEFWPWQDKDIAAIAGLCRELSLEVAQFTGWGFSPGMNDPKNHDALAKAIEEGCGIAQQLGAKAMCVVGGNDQPGMSQPEMHRHIIDGLKRVAPIAEQHGVTLLLEPMNIRVDHKGHCLYGTPPAVSICREVGSPRVKVLWDLYHAHISEGDLCGHLREGFDQLGYAQIADHPGRHEPGTGEIHYPRVLRELHELGYRGAVGVECTPSSKELTAAIAVAAADVW